MIGNVDVMIPPMGSEPLDVPGADHGGVPRLDHDAADGLVVLGADDPPVVGVPVLPGLQLVHEVQVLLGAGLVVARVLLALVLLVPAKQEIQPLPEDRMLLAYVTVKQDEVFSDIKLCFN